MNNTLPKLDKPSAKPTTIKSVCVYCASSMGTSPLYAEEATSKCEGRKEWILMIHRAWETFGGEWY